jgi:mannose-1-phosphate guanylyltransferase
MLLAAGLGTRLRPLTDERPKPVVPVRHEPLAAGALRALAAAGADRIGVNLHHLPEVARERLEACAPRGVRLAFAVERSLLGTGGGLRAALPQVLGPGIDVADLDPSDVVVVMNGDVLFEPDLRGAIEAHRRSGAVATMVVRLRDDGPGHGAIEVDARVSRVVRLHGLPARPAGGTLRPATFTGVHLLAPRALAALPTPEQARTANHGGCIVRSIYRRFVDDGEPVGAFVDESPWRDLGTLEAYLAGNLEGFGVHDVDVHPGARIGAGARLARAVVGAGADVGAGAELEQVVVWDGAHVPAGTRLRRAVVTPRRVVPLDERGAR